MHLAELENAPIRRMLINPAETQYLELKNPLTAALYSFFLPGLGQLYINRIVLGVYAMFWWWIYVTLSYAQKSFIYLIRGDISQSINMLQPHWLLFMPSVLGGAVYHAYNTAVEHNKIFRIEQRRFLTEKYQESDVRIF